MVKMRFPRRFKPKKGNEDRALQTVDSTNKESVVSEASSDLHFLTKKHSSGSSKSSLSFTKSKRVKDFTTFTAVIDSIDGIISTNTGRHVPLGQRNQPIFAILSYYKRVATTGNTVKTNMLSLPLVKSSSSIGKRERYFARFSEDDDQQSFNLATAMRRSDNFKCGYEPRELDFEISLMRGSEVAKLGYATLVLTGDEDGTLQLISVNSDKAVTNTVRKAMVANKPSKTSLSSVTTTGAKMVSFSNDPTHKYTLQRGILRVSIHLTPSNPTEYLGGAEDGPASMLLSIGHSDSISCLSSGGMTTEMIKQRYPNTSISGRCGQGETLRYPSAYSQPQKNSYKSPANSDYIMQNSYNKLKKLHTTEDLGIFCSITESETLGDENTAVETIESNERERRARTNHRRSEEYDEDSVSDEYSDDGGDSTRIPNFSSGEEEDKESGRGSYSEDESALLDDISLGSIRFKDIAESRSRSSSTKKKTASELLA